jgi:hypothetical protein
MAWYAKVDSGVVTQVSYVVEQYDAAWCAKEYGGTWIAAFEDGNKRKNFPAVGFQYDAELDMFYPLKPYISWSLNFEKGIWQAPTAIPTDGKRYFWDEATQSWVESTMETAA